MRLKRDLPPRIKRRLFMRLSGQPWFRFPFWVLAYAFLKPLQWVLHQTPFALPFYKFIGKLTNLRTMSGDSFGAYKPDAKDVIVCSYGKSGTNWSLQIAHQIAYSGEGDFEYVHDIIPWPDGFSIPLEDPYPKSDSPSGMRVIKTHLPMDCVPYTEDARYVCVVRDPKDVAVSGYYFFRSVLLGPLMLPLDLWVELFLTGRNLLGSWAEHLDGYWRMRHRDNVLFLTFEEMKADLPGTVDKIAALMGVALSAEERARVIELSEFSHMRSVDHKFYPGLVTPFSSPTGKMMREGKSGAALGVLTPEQRAKIDAVCKGELEALGSDFPYEEKFSRR